MYNYDRKQSQTPEQEYSTGSSLRRQKKQKKRVAPEYMLFSKIEDIGYDCASLQFDIDFPVLAERTPTEQEEDAERLEQEFDAALVCLAELLPKGVRNQKRLIDGLKDLISAVEPQKRIRVVNLLGRSQTLEGNEGLKLLAYIAAGRYDQRAINHLASRITDLEVAKSLLESLLTMCTEVPLPKKGNIMMVLLEHKIFQDALDAKFRAEVRFKGMSRSPHWIRALVECLPNPKRVFVCEDIDAYIEDIYPTLERIRTSGMGSYCFLNITHQLDVDTHHTNMFMLTKHEGGIITLIFRDSLGFPAKDIDNIVAAVRRIMPNTDVRVIADAIGAIRQYSDLGCVFFALRDIMRFQTEFSNLPYLHLEKALQEPNSRQNLSSLSEVRATVGYKAPLYDDVQRVTPLKNAGLFDLLDLSKMKLEESGNRTIDKGFFPEIHKKLQRKVRGGKANFFAAYILPSAQELALPTLADTSAPHPQLDLLPTNIHETLTGYKRQRPGQKQSTTSPRDAEDVSPPPKRRKIGSSS